MPVPHCPLTLLRKFPDGELLGELARRFMGPTTKCPVADSISGLSKGAALARYPMGSGEDVREVPPARTYRNGSAKGPYQALVIGEDKVGRRPESTLCLARGAGLEPATY